MANAIPKRRLTSDVQCKICGKYLQIISWHHLRVHYLTRTEYLEMFELCPDEAISDGKRLATARRKDYFPFRKKELKKTIRNIYDVEKNASSHFCSKKYPSVFHQAIWLFGNWNEAIKAAGLDPNKIRKHEIWSPEKVILTIRQRRESKLPLSGTNFIENNHRLVDAARAYFGSWRKAVAASGISTKDVGIKENWSKEKVVQEIQKLKKSRRDNHSWKNLAKAATRRFGSMKNAVVAAGINPEAFYGKRFWNKDKVIQIIKERQRSGQKINAAFIQKNEPPLAQAAYGLFGTWAKALEAAGIDPAKIAKHQSWTKKKLISEIRRLDKATQAPLTDHLMRSIDLRLLSACRRHFGSWRLAAQTAKLSKVKRR